MSETERPTATRYAGIEAGGTKFVVAVARGDHADSIEDRTMIATTDPETTVEACLDFLDTYRPLTALGVGAFGPIRLDHGPHYGTFQHTPKHGWDGFNLADALSPLGCPTVIDTDVNAAALAEARYGGVGRLVYITVGTGIGGGLVIDGRTVTGSLHPEMGHISVERYPGDDFVGICPSHRDCLEGLASGPALEQRFGVTPGDLGTISDAAIPLATHYLGQLVATVNYVVAPERVVIGGGVMQIPGMFTALATETDRRIARYTMRASEDAPWLIEPNQGTGSGIIGALMLAAGANPIH